MQLAIYQRFSGQFSCAPNGFAAWVERTWISLGGEHCIDEDAYQHVQAFFQLIAVYAPDGSEAASQRMSQNLRRLFAQPSAITTDRAGVQLMTIHKAKGLGFNVVVVPALERTVGRIDSPLIHWTERTRRNSSKRELLIAPLGTKGAENSATYKWVCDQRRKEEDEELNRLLYVASTRARNELHLIGTVSVKREDKGETTAALKMGKPKARSLLATGWPHFEQIFADQLDDRFATMQMAASQPTRSGPFLVTNSAKRPGGIFELAAAASPHGQLLQRLPSDWSRAASEKAETQQTILAGSKSIREKSIANATAQAIGITVHALFQQIASFPVDDPRIDPSRAEDYWLRIATALLRHAGLTGKQLTALAEHVVKMLQTAAQDAHGRWILGRQRHARSESAWTSHHQGKFKTMRADRVFIAGSEPLLSGETHLWIVDYKTTPLSINDSDLSLLQERSQHEAQLEGYARVLRAALPSDLPIRLALYYPSLPRLDWWVPA